ncbi:MAG: redoxin domain-containing protein [Sphingobacteriia bacterium]|nr:redoxin domain-containing protein [Sphingobacteriia bacterium]
MQKSILAVISLLLLNTVNCQTSDTLRYPKVGEQCPEFVIRNLSNFFSEKLDNNHSISISKLSGKWAILDFWNKECVSCVASFPKMNQLYHHFKNRIYYIQVGLEDREGEIRPQFLKYKEKLNLNFPYAFDSLLCQRLDISSGPHIVILDDKGIVRAVTAAISERQLDSLIAGKQPKLLKSYYRQSTQYNEAERRKTHFDLTNPLLMYGNGGPDSEFLSRSLLAKFDPQMGGAKQDYLNWPKKSGLLSKYANLQIAGFSLYSFYALAYWGTLGRDSANSWYWQDEKYEKSIPRPILEMEDKSIFNYDQTTYKNLFAYSLLVPAKFSQNQIVLKESLQNELKRTFGYEVNLEIRKMPYWRLTLLDPSVKDKLSSKGDSTYFKDLVKGYSFKAKNLPVRQFIHWFAFTENTYPVINETGIDGGLDILFDGCIKTAALDDVRIALHKNGLNIVPGEKNFEVLVIKDPMEKPVSTEMSIPGIVSEGKTELLSGVLSPANINEFYSAKVRGKDYGMMTLLDLATLLNIEQSVLFLLDNGANPNLVIRSQGETPLMHAIKNGNLKVVKALVANGAFVNNTMLLGNNWTTPISFANEQRQVEIEAYLKSIGAK